jgi:hypothetical protein
MFAGEIVYLSLFINFGGNPQSISQGFSLRANWSRLALHPVVDLTVQLE